LIDDDNEILAQQKYSCNFIENSTMMPRSERFQGTQISRNESLEDVFVETSPTHHRTNSKQQVYCALCNVFHEKKTLKEDEDVVAKQDGASSEKQTRVSLGIVTWISK
jgi:hypothetical protein